MEWNDVRIFLAIARERTLIAAARKLGQTQPTIGRRLRALEEALGHKLFQRTAEGFVLTEEGNAMRAPAERMEQEALAIDRQVIGRTRHIEGVLRLTSFDWFGSQILVPLLAEFAKLHPRVTVELLTDPRFLSLARREADLAFRIGAFDEPDIVSRKLMRIRYGVYVRKGLDHPVAGDGAGSTLLTLNSGFSGAPDDSWLNKKLPKARTLFRSNSRDVQARMCARGAGVAILPVPLADSIARIERVDLGEEPPSRDAWIGYHRDLRHQAPLRALLDLVIARLSG